MKLFLRAALFACLIAAAARADITPEKLYEDATPSFVAVQFQFTGETMNREFIGPGVVISSDGMIIVPGALVNAGFPDDQLKDFKIIIPSQDKDAEELDAELVGRDERANLAFVKAKAKHDWKPIKFENVTPKIGEAVYSVGILSKAAAYKSYFMNATISALLRGETPQIMVQGGLCAAGSVVFNTQGQAIGLVQSNTVVTGSVNLFDGRTVGFARMGPGLPLNESDERDNSSAVLPPRFFVPASDFLFALSDPPVAGESQKLPWIGVPSMRGLTKDLAEAFKLQNQPAIEIGEVLPDAPAAKAGITKGSIILKINGQPLERPDDPQELPGIIGRQIRKMKVGDKVKLTILPGPNKPAQDVDVTLEDLPKRPNRAKRYYAEDLGFVARELVFQDTYAQHMPADSKGVVVALLKPSGSAETGKLQRGDIITQLNGKAVTDIEQFKTDYETLRKDKPQEAVVLEVIRRFPSTELIRIEPPR